jgi:hypothetical protein
MQMRRYLLFIFILCCTQLNAQTLGGNAVFNFLSQPSNAQLSALGGVNISSIGNDVGLAFHNPSLLRATMNQQANLSFNSFLAGIKNYGLTTAWHLASSETNIAVGANYFDYGNIMQTDASGNLLGNFRPVDYVVQVMASRQYHERFYYGVTMKYVNSSYAQYKSSGLAFDIGLSYYDSANLLQVSVAVKNMGTQLKTYDGSNRKEELPFDIQAGITKRLEKAPLQFSLTAHHLQAFNIHYNDTTFRASEGEVGYENNTTLEKVFSHLVLSTQIFLNEKLELTAGYNFQRRQDLNAYNVSSGLNGFSFGAGLLLKKLNIRYATGFYQRSLFHQLSLNINWNR